MSEVLWHAAFAEARSLEWTGMGEYGARRCHEAGRKDVGGALDLEWPNSQLGGAARSEDPCECIWWWHPMRAAGGRLKSGRIETGLYQLPL